MQGFVDTLAEKVHLGFLAAVTGIKNELVLFFKIALIDMSRKLLMKNRFIKFSFL